MFFESSRVKKKMLVNPGFKELNIVRFWKYREHVNLSDITFYNIIDIRNTFFRCSL